MRRHARLSLVLAGAAVLLAVMVPLQAVALVLRHIGLRRSSTIIPVVFHRILLRLLGIRLRLDGDIADGRPLLLVANHMSWLDIVVIGAVAPCSFVAKADMRDWPLFGHLARLQRTIFVRREARREAGLQAGSIAERMRAREIIVLFPEGTTSDGNALLPFKTPLFEAAKLALTAEMADAFVQPCAIRYERLHGMPIGRTERPHVAWPGDVGLGESLFGIAEKGALDVVVRLGEPLRLTQDSNRKIIAAKAASALRDALA